MYYFLILRISTNVHTAAQWFPVLVLSCSPPVSGDFQWPWAKKTAKRFQWIMISVSIPLETVFHKIAVFCYTGLPQNQVIPYSLDVTHFTFSASVLQSPVSHLRSGIDVNSQAVSCHASKTINHRPWSSATVCFHVVLGMLSLLTFRKRLKHNKPISVPIRSNILAVVASSGLSDSWNMRETLRPPFSFARLKSLPWQ